MKRFDSSSHLPHVALPALLGMKRQTNLSQLHGDDAVGEAKTILKVKAAARHVDANRCMAEILR